MAARAELDHVDGLAVGSGHLDLTGFLRGDLTGGMAGGALDYEHRLTSGLSAFGRGEVGRSWGSSGNAMAFDAMAGIRIRW